MVASGEGYGEEKVWIGRFKLSYIVVVVQSPSCVRVFATPWTAALQASLSFTISQSLLKLMSISDVILCHPLSAPSLLAYSLSQHQSVFQ